MVYSVGDRVHTDFSGGIGSVTRADGEGRDRRYAVTYGSTTHGGLRDTDLRATPTAPRSAVAVTAAEKPKRRAHAATEGTA